MNSGGDVVINTPKNVRRMASAIREAGVKPELEIFDSGDLHLALDLIKEGVLDGPGLWTFVMGVKYGFAATPETLLYARNFLPQGRRGRPSVLAGQSFPLSPRHGWPVGTCASVLRTTSTYPKESLLKRTRCSSPGLGTSYCRWVERLRLRVKRASNWGW